jgi:RNA polymerase sigma factor (sigma-70 family)
MERIAVYYLALQALSTRERTIIYLRSKGMTLKEVGQEFDVTRERIRQIETKAGEIFRSVYIKLID